jgi:hypothetical protein
MPIYVHVHAHPHARAHAYGELFSTEHLADYPAGLWAMGPSEVNLSITFFMVAFA